jgi:hypothetical protein
MAMITYEFTCPVCGQETTKRRTSIQPEPCTCSLACANQLRRGDRHPSRKYHYTPDMERAIITAARGSIGALKALWHTDPRFRTIPYPSVRRHAWTLGAIRSKPSDTWSEKETAFAADRYARGVPLDSLAKQMRRHGWHRSVGAIQGHLLHHATRKDIYLTLNQVADGMGVDWHVVQRWIARHGLRVHHQGADQGGERLLTYLDPSALRAWVIAHPFEVAKHAPDLVWLIGLLCSEGAGDTRDHPADEGASGDWMNGHREGPY